MEVNEIRVGIIVHFKGLTPGGQFDKIMALSEHEIFCDTFNSDNCFPVPITEEWLVKFGEMKGKTNNGIYPMYYNIDDNHLYSDDNFALCNKISWIPILYVHQLQNLYRSLTGEELSPNHS